MIVANSSGQVLWARRVGQQAWQFPQGGIQERESPEEALFRELKEEIWVARAAGCVTSYRNVCCDIRPVISWGKSKNGFC